MPTGNGTGTITLNYFDHAGISKRVIITVLSTSGINCGDNQCDVGEGGVIDCMG